MECFFNGLGEAILEKKVPGEANPEIVSEHYSVATIAKDYLKSWPTISE